MTKDEFRQALKRNGLTVEEFAALTGRSERTVYDYGGRYPVPYDVRLILRLLDERGGSRGLVNQKCGNPANNCGIP